MAHNLTLKRHHEIKNWVVDHHGMPAMTQARNSMGQMRQQLALKFAGRERPTSVPSVVDDVSPVSWSAWLAELDRQQLALRVDDGAGSNYEFVKLQAMN